MPEIHIFAHRSFSFERYFKGGSWVPFRTVCWRAVIQPKVLGSLENLRL